MTFSDNVPHETKTVELYIVVDVETTGLNPAEDRILTLGAVAVTYDGNIATINEDFFYRRIDQSDWIDDVNWYSTIADPKSTLSWWVKQSIEAQQEAWRGSYYNAPNQKTVTEQFNKWVAATRVREEAWEKPVFVANPVSFDKPFVDQLFETHGKPNPFDYRSLCLRSMAYGANPHSAWGGNVRTNKSLVPHHAFFDAYAQAHDLVDLLGDRDETGYEDKLYWLQNPSYSTYLELVNAIDGKGWHPHD